MQKEHNSYSLFGRNIKGIRDYGSTIFTDGLFGRDSILFGLEVVGILQRRCTSDEFVRRINAIGAWNSYAWSWHVTRLR